MAIQAPVSKVTGVHGWETEAEELILSLLMMEVPSEGGVVVELGGEYGRSACAFLHGLHECDCEADIWTVDLFPEDHHQVGDLHTHWQQNVSDLHAAHWL